MECTIFKEGSKDKRYKIIRNHPLLDIILNNWRAELGKNYQTYKNHSLRMINYCFYKLDPDEETKQKIVFAAAFHQITLFFQQNPSSIKNYTISSAELFEDNFHVFEFYHSDAVLNSILKHNSFNPKFYNKECFESVFWDSYMTDLTFGTLHSKLPSDFVQQVKKCIPMEGYHSFLIKKKAKVLF